MLQAKIERILIESVLMKSILVSGTPLFMCQYRYISKVKMLTSMSLLSMQVRSIVLESVWRGGGGCKLIQKIKKEKNIKRNKIMHFSNHNPWGWEGQLGRA